MTSHYFIQSAANLCNFFQFFRRNLTVCGRRGKESQLVFAHESERIVRHYFCVFPGLIGSLSYTAAFQMFAYAPTSDSYSIFLGAELIAGIGVDYFILKVSPLRFANPITSRQSDYVMPIRLRHVNPITSCQPDYVESTSTGRLIN